MVMIPLGFFLFSRRFNRLQWIQDSASALVGMIAGLAFSLSSPGAAIRRQAIQQGIAIDYLEKLSEAILGLPFAFIIWIMASVSLFSIVAIVFGFLLGNFIPGVNDMKIVSRSVVRSAMFFQIFSLVIFLVNSALAKVTYSAWWQTLTGRFFIFVAATMLGVWLGLKIRESNFDRTKKLTITLLIFTTAGFLQFWHPRHSSTA